jgi:hypothetical protein
MKLDELRQLVRAADPAAVLVPAHVLERVILTITGLPGLFGQVPHRKCLMIDRHLLFRHVEQDELDLESDQLLPPVVLLLSRPSADRLAAVRREECLLKYWQRLFHASIHRELEARLSGPFNLDERIAQLGPAAFAEIRTVLKQDDYLLPPADDRSTYIEFASVYLELRYFSPNLVPVYFPGLPPLPEVDALLAQDVDAPALFTSTRLAGAPDPVARTAQQTDESHDYYWKLVRSAQRSAQSGNQVRAAVLHTRAARVAPAALTRRSQDEAHHALQQLTKRLQTALQLTDADAAEWLKDLPALLDKADQGNTPVEAALLFDLQKVCLDHERVIYTLDLVEWAASAGKRPIKRPLPSQRLVLITKHLRSAARRLTTARLTETDRQHLAALLHKALTDSEERLRQRFRPVFTDALHDAGLRPHSPPETTAFAKLVEELLDRIIEQGFLNFSDLRDALSRNQMKLPDLATPQEFIQGDPLLRLDRRLATLLDGVYRRSDFYMRWIQRATSLGFATMAGRWLTRNVVVPFGGAFLLLEMIGILIHEGQKYAGHPTVKEGWLQHNPLYGWFDWTYGLLGFALGLFCWAVLHSTRLQSGMVQMAGLSYRTARAVCVEMPTYVLSNPVWRAVFFSWPFQLAYNYVGKPAVGCALVWLVAPWLFQSREWIAFTIIIVALAINSRSGQAIEALITRSFFSLYFLLRSGLLPGLVRWTMQLFRQLLMGLEYAIFSVDEWLRFRTGEKPTSLVIRAVLGLIWFPISFATRFYFVVLVEPALNPVKLPLSIVAGKFMVPVLVAIQTNLPGLLAPYLFGSEYVAGWVVLGLITFWLPDAVTFVIWELKENWKLYRQNRSGTLRPVMIGTHGETMRELLHPGFHSGTVPHLFQRLREVERQAPGDGNWRAVRAYRQELHEIESAIERWATREMLSLLHQSAAWPGQPLRVAAVRLATNRIRIDLAHADYPGGVTTLSFEHQGGWIVAALTQPGWLANVPSPARSAFTTALAGAYQLASVDIVAEQLQAHVPTGATFALTPLGLRLFTPTGTWLYDFNDRSADLRPRTAEGLPVEGPALMAEHVLYRTVRVPWDEWESTWQRDHAGQAPTDWQHAGERLVLLPPLPPAPAVAPPATDMKDEGRRMKDELKTMIS